MNRRDHIGVADPQVGRQLGITFEEPRVGIEYVTHVGQNLFDGAKVSPFELLPVDVGAEVHVLVAFPTMVLVEIPFGRHVDMSVRRFPYSQFL